MANNPYVVARLVPDAPVDGPTFATYLDDLRLQLVDAYTGAPLTDYVYFSSLVIAPAGPASGAVVSEMTSDATTFVAANNYGTKLEFSSTNGVSVGSFVFTTDNPGGAGPTIPPNSALKVTDVKDGEVTLSGNLPNYIPAGTVVSFAPTTIGTVVTDPNAPAPTFTKNTSGAITGIDGNPPGAHNPGIVVPIADVSGIIVGMSVTGGGVPAKTTVAAVNTAAAAFPVPSITLSQQATSGAGTALTFKWPTPFAFLQLNATGNTVNTLTFGSTDGIAFGMTLTPIAGVIDPGTTVKEVTTTTVTLSKNLVAAPTTAVTFNLQLSSGIAQQTQPQLTISFTGIGVVIVPLSVATAVIPLNSSPTPSFLNVRVIALRGTQTLPVDEVYYNVLSEDGQIPDPSEYQNIPENQTGFYLSLPPPPLNEFVSLKIPSDGSPPAFDELNAAIRNVLQKEGNPPATLDQLVAALIGSPSDCRRIAYEIVWSYKNTLPDPPDKLTDMYTNPPNPGGSTGSGGQSNLEQDRIKFEGSLHSFYSTRDADAERLAKFVAAASAAIYCESTSLNSQSALMDFPVDPSAALETAVESELRVQGLGLGGPGDLEFGVPAAYFYALGASHDKSATAIQRFQTATGDSIERLLHEFAVAQNAGVIRSTEAFVNKALGLPPISPFQAARRLVALRASTLSTTPTMTAYSGTPLAAVIKSWLASDDPTPVPPPNPPPTYDTVDFNIWVKTLETSDPQGYLYLDLDSLTQGYVIPLFGVKVNSGAASTLRFDGGGWGIGPGMPVSGTNIAPGTTVTQVVVSTAAGATTTTVTLSAPVTGAIVANQVITFNQGVGNPNVAPVPATTTVDCPNGNTLTFGGTAGIGVGLTVFGHNIPSGTTVTNVAATTVTLSNAVAGDVPPGSVITFATLASTLANQIFAWLPTTATPAAPQNIATLRGVTSVQWTSLFTDVGNVSWLPPFTQPVKPGVNTNVPIPAGGYTSLRIRAFVRAVQQFFAISSSPTTAKPLPANAPPTFELPQFDPIALAVQNMPGFTFAGALNSTDLSNAVQVVFPGEPAAQKWLTQAMTAISELSQVASVVPEPTGLPNPVSLRFSIIEAMYARGFRSASDITNLSADEFHRALTGTVAYDFANSTTNSLYQKAATLAPPPPAPTNGSGTFQPINPDGSLVNCIPPPCLSPTSPIAYLQEMLRLSPGSTCENPFAAPTKSQTSLGEAAQARRGPIGKLLASCANLETPLPSVDIVNECLEYLAATQPPAGGSTSASPHGTVYDTSPDDDAGHKLCKSKDCSGEDCHQPATLFAALPEYSTPSTPVTANQAVEPAGFDNLKNDFSSCELPYSQAVDVSRTYLGHFGSCRFEELRTFRRCITEFALDPTHAPPGFQSHLWRYPVRLETAMEYLGITPEEYTSVFLGTAPQSCVTVTEAPAPTGKPNPAGEPSPAGKQGSTGDKRTKKSVGQARAAASAAATSAAATSAATTSGTTTGTTTTGTTTPGGTEPRAPEGPISPSVGGKGGVVKLSEFLSALCLSYCEFVDFAKLGLIQVRLADDETGAAIKVPDCEPCCLKDYEVVVPGGDQPQSPAFKIFVFIRLWKKLQQVCGARYSFQELSDICTVLQLTNSAGALNPEFIRQLAAFQMLRDHFKLALLDRTDQASGGAGLTGAERTHLLALWVGNTARKWDWAVRELLEGVTTHARQHYQCDRPEEFVEHLELNLDELSRLAGFNPPTTANPSTDTWNSSPACSLRFAEVLAKMAGSRFRIGELLYLFNATPPQHAKTPFLQQDSTDALLHPLGVPEDEPEDSLWKLRKELLCAEVREEEVCEWTWARICGALRDKFGYAPSATQDPLLSFGRHFFPEKLEASGIQGGAHQRQYRVSLTSSTQWNAIPESPFHYDSSSKELWIQLPLRDRAVAATLSRLPQLNPAEQVAVQDLYFAPRVDLTLLSFLFPDWQSAQRHLVEEAEEEKRWAYFRRHFALADSRRRAVAEHLARHVGRRTGCDNEDLEEIASLVLSRLLADENGGTPWESDSGALPAVTWTPAPCGGAIAALLGLTGTGLVGEYQAPLPDEDCVPDSTATGKAPQTLWREVRGPLTAFGHERDESNSPVPTVLPALSLPMALSTLVDIQNGYGDRSRHERLLGGAQGFRVRWSGTLLVECDGEYEFHAGAPAPNEEKPDFERSHRLQWRLTLRRGQKTWTVLNHEWPGESEPAHHCVHLRRGAYHIVAEYNQPAPKFGEHHVHPNHTGFQVKYAGPDSDGRLVSIPLTHLYRERKEHTLDAGIQFLPGSQNAQAFLKAFYTSTLRDIRRTYQRAFKAVSFAGKLGLSARRNDARQSELGYMLANSMLFAGRAYYRSTGSFAQHLAPFDFNLLPLRDSYLASVPVPSDRSSPSLQRTQALFDCWERLFDYGRVRHTIHHAHKGPVWHLFEEALTRNPTDPAPLLRHIDARQQCWPLDLSFYQDQTARLYAVSSADLQDDRWLIRVWRADRWIRRLLRRFHPKDITTARPALWAAQDPGAPMPATGLTETGNANLTAFINDGCLESGEPRRYQELKRLNDGLRERGRRALLAYLCAADRVQLPWLSVPTYATSPKDLSDLLLMDVEAGLCERASRIEEAITALHTFARRAMLGQEPGWKVGHRFAQLWEDRFESYRTWERCKRRELYQENWIEWSELGKARRIEAFRFLESRLRSSTLTLAAPGGLDWWADIDRALEHAPKLLQRRVPSELHPLTAPPQSATREGLATLGTPEYADAPTWLTSVPEVSGGTGGQSGGGTPGNPSGGPGNPTGGSSGSPGGTIGNPGGTPVINIAAAPAGAAGPVTPARQVRALVVDPTAGDQSPARQLPFWMESAMKLGTRFLRIAAAGEPQDALKFVPHADEARKRCCQECGEEHPILVDEYYFWLVKTRFYSYDDETDSQNGTDASFNGSYQFGFQDSYYDPYQQQSAEWDDEDEVPKLLAKWQSNPAVRLAWCRVHNGQFQQPRKSTGYVPISPTATLPADLIFLGRAGDSVYFKVSGAPAQSPAGYEDTSPGGFRFDLPSDQAIALPEVLKPPAPPVPNPYPGGLICYPFFAYEDPGARLFPATWFSPALLVASALRDHCRFDVALKWYQRAFDPLQRDCTWMNCSVQASNTPTKDEITRRAFQIWVRNGRRAAEQTQDWLEAESELRAEAEAARRQQEGTSGGACCDSSQTTAAQARNRAVTLEFCQTLLDWGDVLMCRGRAPEAFRQARTLFDTAARITGVRPRSVLMPEPESPATVSQFVPAFAPLNPRLLDLYDTVADRVGLIHACLNGRRLNGHGEVSYFGDDPLRQGWRTEADPCDDDNDCCCRPSPYRFTFQIQRALELAGRVREHGAQLVAAYEKGDAEILASIHAEQERELLALALPIRQDQWRDADWQIQALQQAKDSNQASLTYFTNLHQNGLINDEIQNLTLSTNAMQTRTSANVIAAVGESMTIVPDFFVGAMSTFSQIPIGTKLGGLFDAISKFMHTVADIQGATASIDMTQAGWDRRAADWFHEMQTRPAQIQEIELQLLGAHRRRDQAMQELNNQQRQLENAAEVQDFLRDKFTATELYLHLRKQTAGLHSTMYRLARCAALEAQRAFNFERGHTTRRFIPADTWDGLHEGLMAGERLEAALHQMQKAYFDENEREYELTKHVSLRQHFPQEFVRLKTTGCCEIEIPEWMHDLDYPGMFMRRWSGLRVTVPVVTGPFTGVHCKVTLLNSQTRIDPRLEVPAARCCCEHRTGNDYEACPHDRRIVRTYGAREAIATSSAQNDSGLFEFNFHDERRRPFEFHGAACRLRIEIPPENNYFPRESLGDFILHMDITAREGGITLRRAASAAAQRHLPGSGWCFLDVRHEFPDAWQLLRSPRGDRDAPARLNLRLERRMFPFIPAACDLLVDKVAVFLTTPECCDEERKIGECPCPTDEEPGCYAIEVTHGSKERHCEPFRVACVASEECADVYCGIFDAQLEPLGRRSTDGRRGDGRSGDGRSHPEISLRFSPEIGELENVYLLCRYQRHERHEQEPRHEGKGHHRERLEHRGRHGELGHHGEHEEPRYRGDRFREESRLRERPADERHWEDHP